MSAHSVEYIEQASHGVAASTATAVLIVLSWFNAVHSPMFDCIRVSAQAWRVRRVAPQLACADWAAEQIHGRLIVTTRSSI